MNAAQVGALLAAGRAREALAAAREGAARHPSDPHWRVLLGAALHASGASPEGAAELRKAVSLDARAPIAWNTLGAVLVELGELGEGEAALREALRLDAAYLEARFNLALALKQAGDLAAARGELEQVLARQPGFELARLELATALVAAGDARAARPLLESLLARHPGDPRVLANLAAAHARLGDPGAAAAACERVLAARNACAPDIAAVAHTLAALGRRDEARAAAQRAAAMGPDSMEALSTAGDVLAQGGHWAEAHACFIRVARRRPGARAAWRRAGTAAASVGDWHAAREAFAREIEIAPSDADAACLLATALAETGAHDDAITLLARLLETQPSNVRLLSNLVKMKGMACDWDGMEALVDRLREAGRAGEPIDPQTGLHLAQVDGREQRVWAENWARVQFARGRPREAAAQPRGNRRLRIGYLSADFWYHATAFLIVGLLENHDRARFEVFAYSAGRADSSEIRRRIVAGVEHFVELGAVPAERAAQRISEDRLDILFDLGGYVKSSRMDILAWRPAALQAHFLGYPGTTGASFIDFLVADGVVAPAGREAEFSERLLRMPACYQPNDPRRADPPASTRAALGLAEDAIVLCSFNQAIKIRAEVFTRWCDLLGALPEATLWLADPGEAARGRLARFAAARGVDPARLVFAPYVSQEEHMGRLRSADIALDTFPYGSHTTASDAVWAGVPLVALTGDTFASRVSTSVLRAAGCAELAFDDARLAFEATLALAREARLREDARRRLAAARSSPLFDAAGFARAFEALIERAVAAPA